MLVCCECSLLSGRGPCDKLITRPEDSYRLWCVVVCDLETSWMRRPWPAGGCCAKKYHKCVLVFMWSTLYWSSCEVPFIGLHVKYPLLVFMWSALYWYSCEVPFIGLHVKYPLFLSYFMETWTFSTDFRKTLKCQISWISVQWEPSCAMRTGGHRGMMKLIVAFPNFASEYKNKEPKICTLSSYFLTDSRK
jgi:hypothetical protein